jgi:hypothetical protein
MRCACQIVTQLNFLGRFRKNTEILNLLEISPVVSELFRVNGRTDRYDEDNNRFSQFCECA